MIKENGDTSADQIGGRPNQPLRVPELRQIPQSRHEPIFLFCGRNLVNDLDARGRYVVRKGKCGPEAEETRTNSE
jgi:hypothetical protein